MTETAPSEDIVKLEKLYKTYYAGSHPVPVLKDISFSIRRREFVGILGTSGSGKSTMLNILGMLDVPTAGKYYLEEYEVDLLSDAELATIRNRKIGFIFQSFNLFPHLSVAQNIEIPMLYGRVSRRERRERAIALAERVGLSHRLGHRPNQLSGGECQRVAIARALSNRPSFLLADEPTGNLDEKTGLEIMKLFHELNDSGATIIMVTHNPDLSDHFDQIIHLRNGQVTQREFKQS